MPNRYVDDSTWFALGVIATLAYTYVTNRIGRFTISLGRKAHDLNVKLARCEMGTICTMNEAPYILNRPDITRFAIVTSIYNTGDLAARKLKGNWNLTCSHSVYNRTCPLWADSVSKALPYNLEPYILASNEITQAIRQGQATVKVNIEFEFFGLEDEATKYSATYEYSHPCNAMVRVEK